MLAAASISAWYCSRTAWSTWTSGGARAGAATNSRDWLPTSLRASQLGRALVLFGILTRLNLQERLLEVVVGLGGDVVVLEVFLAVESDGLGLDFALLDIDLVTG
jgi:hypothetical protein